MLQRIHLQEHIVLWTLFAVIEFTVGIDLQNAKHLTAIVGDDVVLDCPLDFPSGQPVPYVIEWKKQKLESPLYIWYDGYPPHVADTYKGRVSRVDVRSRRFGMASLNMSTVMEADSGWYECVVHFLNRSPAVLGNGTWVHLDVHAPPRLLSKSPKDVFVNIGDSVILSCESRGTPEPVISWYKADIPVQSSERISIKNEGSELRITRISQEDIGDYTCFAENSEGNVHWTSKVIMAGGAVIVSGPRDVTAIETNQAVLSCEGRSLPANFSIGWLREDIPVQRHSGLESRHRISANGSLFIDPVSAEDAGRFTCEVSNGIGTPQRASAYLTVEYGAHVPYTPSVQYLPMGLEGIIRCHIKANPSIQFVNWYRNRREYYPKNEPGVSLLINGSLHIEKVSSEHQGTYMCRPFNLHGNKGDSADMQVVVREPPRFLLGPNNLYQRKVYDTIQMPCVAEGTPQPEIMWRRHDNQSLPSDRVSINQGNITITSLRKSDFGYYECIARNSVSTIATSTQLVVEGTTPHAPHNVSTNASSYAVTVEWLPGYSGGDNFHQRYVVWYQQKDVGNWNTYEVVPPGTTRITIYHLLPNSTYEIMVAAKNSIGDGMFSEKVLVRTPDARADPAASRKEALEAAGEGPGPGAAVDVTIKETPEGYLLTWKPGEEDPDAAVLYYSVKYKPEDGTWTRLGDEKLTVNKYLVKRLLSGKSYSFKVFSHSLTSFRSSETVLLSVPSVPQRKAITAALVGGLLLLIVSIILSVCTVKICNKHKRRKQEKEYNRVACRVTEARSGLHSPVSMKRPALRIVPRLISHASQLLWRPRPSLPQGLLDELDLTPRRAKMVYSVEMEYSQPLAWISRSPDGRFELQRQDEDDDGGFLEARRSWQHAVLAGRRVSHGFGRYRIPEQRSPSSPAYTVLSPDGRRFRASSPGPVDGQLGPFELSALSSVPPPDSAERTFPSTVQSSASQLACRQQTPSGRVDYDRRLPSLRVIHEALPARLYENWPPTGRWRGPLNDAGTPAGDTPLVRYFQPVVYRHIQPPPIADIPVSASAHAAVSSPRLYANLGQWPPSPPQQQRPVPQRPLATSSPPPLPVYRRSVYHAEPQAPPHGHIKPVHPPPPAIALYLAPTTDPSPGSSLSRQHERPLSYTRDRLQAAIGQVRSAVRPGLDESAVDPLHDKSTSSGLGSKNSSSQQTQFCTAVGQPPHPPRSSPALDISVDDHYEFDPVLTPAGESPLLVPHTAAPTADMEARVQAMRHEFQQYRQRYTRTAHRQPSQSQTGCVVMETVC